MSVNEIEVYEQGGVLVDERGVIEMLIDDVDAWLEEQRTNKAPFTGQVIDFGQRFICPGFVDAHYHAPQYVFSGTGYDLELLDWLETYTFPTEAKFADVEFARSVYNRVVEKTLSSGTTCISYFGTIHQESCEVLADICEV